MRPFKISAWRKVNYRSWIRPGLCLSAAAATLAVAYLSSEQVPFHAPKDYLGALVLPRRHETSSLALYLVLFGLVLVPVLGRYLHELDARKKDGTAKPLRTSVLVTVVSTFAIGLAIRIAYHVAYRTLTPTPAPLELVAMPLLITVIYTLVRAAFWSGGESQLDEVRRGIRVISSPREAARAFARESKRRRATGVKLHPSLTLPLDQERQHILLFGAPGSGKTQVMLPLLRGIQERGDPVLLYDYKGDYTGLFGEDEATLILSPFDARGARWDIALDVDTELKAAEFAASLIPDGVTKEPIFRRAAQDLLTGVVCRLQAERPRDWTIPDLIAILAKKELIVEACQLYRPAALNNLGSLEGRQTAGIIAELRTGTIQLEYLAKGWARTDVKISLAEWATDSALQKRYRMIIIRGNQQYKALSGFLTTQLFALFAKKMLSLPDSRERQVWAFLDEFGNLPRIEGIEELLTAVRSKGLRVVAAIQDIAQVEVSYSPAFSRTFFNCFGTVLAGLNSGATAKWLSENFGRNQVEREIHGESTQKRVGSAGGKTRSTQHQVVVEAALLDTDFSNLAAPSRGMTALFWAKIGGWPLAKLAFPIMPVEPVYPTEVTPEWITTAPKAVPAAEAPVPPSSELPPESKSSSRKPQRTGTTEDDLMLKPEA